MQADSTMYDQLIGRMQSVLITRVRLAEVTKAQTKDLELAHVAGALAKLNEGNPAVEERGAGNIKGPEASGPRANVLRTHGARTRWGLYLTFSVSMRMISGFSPTCHAYVTDGLALGRLTGTLSPSRIKTAPQGKADTIILYFFVIYIYVAAGHRVRSDTTINPGRGVAWHLVGPRRDYFVRYPGYRVGTYVDRVICESTEF